VTEQATVNIVSQFLSHGKYCCLVTIYNPMSCFIFENKKASKFLTLTRQVICYRSHSTIDYLVVLVVLVTLVLFLKIKKQVQ